MKEIFGYAVGYVAAFIYMTLLAAVVIAFGVTFVVGVISFATWQLPTALPSILGAIRFCIALGSIIGALFVISKDGTKFAKEAKERIIQ